MPTIALVALVLARFPVVFGGGVTVSHLADVPESNRAALSADLEFEEPAVGLRYEYFSMFFVDFWTGGGRVVLYDAADPGRGGIPLQPSAVQQLVGETPDELGTPFFYKFPLGWFFVLAVVGVGGWKWYRQYKELS